MRTIVLSVLLGVLVLSSSQAQPNGNATIIMHVRPMDVTATCQTPVSTDHLDCVNVLPTTAASPSSNVDIYVYAKNFDAIAGTQLKFNWPSDWTFMAWMSGCQANQISAVAPSGSERNLSVSFDCTGFGDVLQPIGWLRMQTGASGCVSITVADYPYGTNVIDCVGVTTGLPGSHWGKVCVGPGGIAPCDPPQGGEWESLILEYE